MPGMGAAGFDLDGAFEPQTRVRSNTWPCQRPEEAGTANESGGTPPHQPPGPVGGGLLTVKKNSSRRNAWGNLSYADLITQAITSSPDNRLTLSQIYEWMVQHVSYFKDKGDSNSSAGWKVTYSFLRFHFVKGEGKARILRRKTWGVPEVIRGLDALFLSDGTVFSLIHTGCISSK